jgi:hypothetical protein
MKHSLLLLIITFAIAGCASHGTWSKSDRGAWANLDELIGSHEQAYYVKQWGEGRGKGVGSLFLINIHEE